MQFSVSSEALSRQAAWVAHTLSTRPVVPVLSGVRVDVTPGQVSLTTTDYEAWTTAHLDAATDDTGTVVLPGRMLSALAARLPAGATATFTHDGTNVHLECATVRARLATLPAEDYPTPPDQATPTGTIDAPDLIRVLNQVTSAAANDNGSLPEGMIGLTGARMELSQDALQVAASDRYRVSTAWAEWKPTALDEDVSVLAPAAALARAVKDLTGTVTIGLRTDANGEADAFALTDDSRQFNVALLGAPGVDLVGYFNKLPDTPQVTAFVDTKDLLEALKAGDPFNANDNAKTRLTFHEDRVDLAFGSEVNPGEESSATTSTPAVVNCTESFALGVQAHRLVKALSGHGGAQSRLDMNGPKKPVLITPLDSEGTPLESRHICMPARL